MCRRPPPNPTRCQLQVWPLRLIPGHFPPPVVGNVHEAVAPPLNRAGLPRQRRVASMWPPSPSRQEIFRKKCPLWAAWYLRIAIDFSPPSPRIRGV